MKIYRYLLPSLLSLVSYAQDIEIQSLDKNIIEIKNTRLDQTNIIRHVTIKVPNKSKTSQEGKTVDFTFALVPVTKNSYSGETTTLQKDLLNDKTNVTLGNHTEQQLKDGKIKNIYNLYNLKRTASITGTVCLPTPQDSNKYKWYLPIGISEVTEEQYEAVMSGLNNKQQDSIANETKKGAGFPKTNLTEGDIKLFITELNRIVKEEINTLFPDAKMTQLFQIRLLTGDEWEFAARGGSENQDFDNDYPLSGTSFAEYEQADSEGIISPVMGGKHTSLDKLYPYNGKRFPNSAGLYDMLGNVSEITESYVALGARVGARLICGQDCSTYEGELYTPSSCAERMEKAIRDKTIGFRLVISSAISGDELSRKASLVSNMSLDSIIESYLSQSTVNVQALDGKSVSDKNAETYKKNLDDSLQETQALLQKKEQADSKIKELNKKLKDYEEQIAQLKKTIEEKGASPSSSDKDTSKGERIVKNSENEELKQKNLELDQSVKQLKSQLDSLNSFSKTLKEQEDKQLLLMDYLASVLTRQLHNDFVLALDSSRKLSLQEKQLKLFENQPKSDKQAEADRVALINRLKENIVQANSNINIRFISFRKALSQLRMIDRPNVTAHFNTLKREISDYDASLTQKVKEGIKLPAELFQGKVLELTIRQTNKFLDSGEQISMQVWKDMLGEAHTP